MMRVNTTSADTRFVRVSTNTTSTRSIDLINHRDKLLSRVALTDTVQSGELRSSTRLVGRSQRATSTSKTGHAGEADLGNAGRFGKAHSPHLLDAARGAPIPVRNWITRRFRLGHSGARTECWTWADEDAQRASNTGQGRSRSEGRPFPLHHPSAGAGLRSFQHLLLRPMQPARHERGWGQSSLKM